MLSKKNISDILALPNLTNIATSLKDEETPPKGILIEYFIGAENLTERNITKGIACKALKALYEIHTAYVCHMDIHRRNILLLPDGRVVWIDFDTSVCVSDEDESIERVDLLKELGQGWTYLYARLVRSSSHSVLVSRPIDSSPPCHYCSAAR